MLSALSNFSQTTTMAKASRTAYSTPTTANLNPATSLFGVSLIERHVAADQNGAKHGQTGRQPDEEQAESQMGWLWRNETMVVSPRRRLDGAA